MSAALDRLVEVMARLRNPDGGCPWDLEQNFASIAPYTLEETYEVVEAIEYNDPQAIKEELGDLLFQIVFHAQMGREAKLFDLDAIATAVADKMIERHPHVFGDRDAKTSAKVLANWEKDKEAKREKEARAQNRLPSALDGVSTALPAATRALKLQNRAARVGFDWTDARDILAKIREEIGELEVEMNRSTATQAQNNSSPLGERLGGGFSPLIPTPGLQTAPPTPTSPPKGGEALTPSPNAYSKDGIEDELGDLFFALVNLARRLEVDPETALRRTNRKFERRFRAIETRLAAQNRKPADTSLDEMEKLWNEIKAEEKLKKAG